MSSLTVDSAAFVRWLRTVTGYSQEDISLLCGMPAKNRTLVSYWETGKREPTAEQWKRLIQIAPFVTRPGASVAPSYFLRVAVADPPAEREKNADAVAIGRLGGKARAEKLTPEQRQAQARKARAARRT